VGFIREIVYLKPMKITLLLFSLAFTGTIFGQQVYTSNATQFFPSHQVEAIDRVITVDEEKITIKSVTKEDKVKIQTLLIKGKVTNYDNGKTYVEYDCSARNARARTTVIIKKEKPTYITLLQPSLRDHTTLEESKILLD
jgi:hypothetical protein